MTPDADPLTADVLEGNTRLRAIARAGVGTDNIDKAYCAEKGIAVHNTPKAPSIAVAMIVRRLKQVIFRDPDNDRERDSD